MFQNEIIQTVTKDQYATFLALEAIDFLFQILTDEGWKPRQEEINEFYRKSMQYFFKYKGIMEKDSILGLPEWNVVISNREIKTQFAKKKRRRRKKRPTRNIIKPMVKEAEEAFFEDLKELGAFEAFKKAPIFSVVTTSYISIKKEQGYTKRRKKEYIYRLNLVRGSKGYGSELKTLFVEEVPEFSKK